MGSPVSVVIANLVMEDLEKKALSSFSCPPRFYYRFVDDSIAALKKTHISLFHDHLNRQDPHIQFTVERYGADGIAFLDTLNTVGEDGSVTTTVYRKTTHSDQYLQFSSHHPRQHKEAVVRALYYRATQICEEGEARKIEERKILNSLKGNGYPGKFVESVKRKVKTRSDQINEKRTEEYEGFAVLPYVEGTTERLRRVLNKYDVRVAVRPPSTLKSLLMKPKEPLPMLKQTGIVYEIPCEGCDVRYIGETGRSLNTRRKEHVRSVKLGRSESSALAQHVEEQDHRIAWDGARILAKENKWVQRKWKEAWLIERTENSIANRDNGRTLPEAYKPIIRL